MARMILLAVLVVVGCGYQPDQAKVVSPPERAEEATSAVVRALGLSSAPAVYWYAPDDCGAGAIHAADGECVFGFRIDDVVVLSTQGDLPMRETALAHELGHLASLERDGTSDNACHNGRFYRDPGDVRDCKIPNDQHGLVGAANRALAALGM